MVAAAALLSSSCGGGSAAESSTETLAYSVGNSNKAEIVLVDDDGGNRRHLTRLTVADNHYPYSLDWSPDGRRLAITRVTSSRPLREHRQGRIHIIGADGKIERQIVVETDLYPLAIPRGDRPQWAPDGKSLLALQLEIAVLNIDGRPGPSLGRGESPTWSPDGRRIAFLRHKFSYHVLDGQRVPQVKSSELFTISRDGSDLRRIARSSDTSWGFGSPMWLPDGRSILVLEVRGDSGRLRRIDATGDAESTVLGSGLSTDVALSPDGSRVAFVPDGSFRTIEIMSLDDGKLARLTVPTDYPYFLKWSPAGTKLAYVGGESPGIHVVDESGSNDRRISRLNEAVEVFDWLPSAHS